MAPSQQRFEPARILVVMGVSSSGKTSVGRIVAERLGSRFLEGDDFHPRANVEKMEAGIPLTDADRWPWLESLTQALREEAERSGIAVAASSALKHSYRDFMIGKAGEPVLFIYLDGSKELIAERIAKRKNHFMPPSLLDSQFADLEPPGPDENALTVGIVDPPEVIAGRIVEAVEQAKQA